MEAFSVVLIIIVAIIGIGLLVIYAREFPDTSKYMVEFTNWKLKRMHAELSNGGMNTNRIMYQAHICYELSPGRCFEGFYETKTWEGIIREINDSKPDGAEIVGVEISKINK